MIDGISKKLVTENRKNIVLGPCTGIEKIENPTSALKDVLLNPINITFVIIIFILGYFDYTKDVELKSQIVSVGVLGTFVGIFIGLQAFNPNDIVHSVNDILLGLKTAFFTSIVGMSVSTGLSILQKFQNESKN